jgi:predicted HTH domain antitoxin
MQRATRKYQHKGGIIPLEVMVMKKIEFQIPEEIYWAIGARRDPNKEVLKRLAVALYAERKISLGKAVELANVSHTDFFKLLADFGVYLDYDEEDLREDMETLRGLGRGGDSK